MIPDLLAFAIPTAAFVLGVLVTATTPRLIAWVRSLRAKWATWATARAATSTAALLARVAALEADLAAKDKAPVSAVPVAVVGDPAPTAAPVP